MKRIALLATVALLVAACQDAPSAPPSDLRPSAAATTITNSERIPFELHAFVPCANDGAGEFVVLTGNLHVLSHVTTTEDGKLTLKTHSQPQGISGVGQTTGDSYQATGVTQETFVLNAGGLPLTGAFVYNFRIIGQGPGNNFLVHNLIHVTVNELGVVTATVDNFTIECR